MDLELLHIFCGNNKSLLSQSQQGGCFYCQKIFAPTKIKNWVNEGSQTALCPHCSIDAVLPGCVTELTPEVLKSMYDEWFGKVRQIGEPYQAKISKELRDNIRNLVNRIFHTGRTTQALKDCNTVCWGCLRNRPLNPKNKRHDYKSEGKMTRGSTCLAEPIRVAWQEEFSQPLQKANTCDSKTQPST